MRAVETLKRYKDSKSVNESGLVSSSQTDIHPRLEKSVKRHLENPWLQPLHRPSCEAFKGLKEAGTLDEDKPVILDSGCGTGRSTSHLAEIFPRHNVIGIDQSMARLSRSGGESGIFRNGNCILIRAELSTFWRLLLEDGCFPERHYLLYPNPWPKPAHLKRRWHGHPVFPQLLSLGGQIEMRCNWKIYAREFAHAVNLATGGNLEPKRIRPDVGISPFEQKYLERGQALFSVTVIPAKAGMTVARRDDVVDYSGSASTSGGGV